MRSPVLSTASMRGFDRAVDLIMDCRGRVVVTGMGKSGHIGNKIAATLASTGTPALFLHPAEGIHGDLGMVTKGDIVIALSNSGETEELSRMLPSLKRIGIKIIALTGQSRFNPCQEQRRGHRCGRERRGLSPGARADRQHDRDPGHGGRPCRRAAEPQGIQAKRISPVFTPEAAWASGCCCASGTSCTPAMMFRRSVRYADQGCDLRDIVEEDGRDSGRRRRRETPRRDLRWRSAPLDGKDGKERREPACPRRPETS